MARELVLHSEMQRSRLIQRLLRPSEYNLWGSFGGGLRNGGLSDEGMDLLRDVFSFDYMGAAEFEFGAVPAALNFIAHQAKQGKLVRGLHCGVYYIAPASYEQGVKTLIDRLLEDEYSVRLMEYCGLTDALRNGEAAQYLGWLELDNGFFLFVDLEMFEKTKQLFGI